MNIQRGSDIVEIVVKEISVRIKRHCRAGMPEHALHCLDVRSRTDCQGCSCVTQIARSHSRHHYPPSLSARFALRRTGGVVRLSPPPRPEGQAVADRFVLEQADRRLGEGVIVGVADLSDRSGRWRA